MDFQKSLVEIIPQRYSCRSYLKEPIDSATQQRLANFMDASPVGPLGTPLRFKLLAATEDDRQSLRGLGTYGFIRGATGFIVGAMRPAKKNLEDFGYQMEAVILKATELGLGTCWLGGSFTQSSFSRQFGRGKEETIPAVTATGYPSPRSRSSLIRKQVRGDYRLPWEHLFIHARTGIPLTPESAGPYRLPLEMLRLAPSASNKQPWRVSRGEDGFHFYLQRTHNSGPGSLSFDLLRLADLQRVDIGIAMCHFDLTAHELGLGGQWAVLTTGVEPAEAGMEYVASWVE